jgi:xanthosine utilization system XapX-like protein
MKSNNAANRFLDLLAGILFGFMLASFIVDVTRPNAIKYIGLLGVVGWAMVTCLRLWLEQKQSRSTAAKDPPASTQS